MGKLIASQHGGNANLWMISISAEIVAEWDAQHCSEAVVQIHQPVGQRRLATKYMLPPAAGVGKSPPLRLTEPRLNQIQDDHRGL